MVFNGLSDVSQGSPPPNAALLRVYGHTQNSASAHNRYSRDRLRLVVATAHWYANGVNLSL
jgi:hypothetical protein